jgi:hypothetical protein
MPPALDTVTATGTAIGATLAAATIVAGDSFTIKNAPLTSNVSLLQAWSDHQVAGMVRIRSPKLHDNVDAIRARAQIGVLKPLLPLGAPQKLYPQDTEIVELAGSAVAGDIESVVQMIYYDDLPGQAARLFTWEAIGRSSSISSACGSPSRSGRRPATTARGPSTPTSICSRRTPITPCSA